MLIAVCRAYRGCHYVSSDRPAVTWPSHHAGVHRHTCEPAAQRARPPCRSETAVCSTCTSRQVQPAWLSFVPTPPQCPVQCLCFSSLLTRPMTRSWWGTAASPQAKCSSAAGSARGHGRVPPAPLVPRKRHPQNGSRARGLGRVPPAPLVPRKLRCIASSDEVPGRRAPRREVEEGALVGRTELGTIALLTLIGTWGPSQGKGGGTPGAKEKDMDVYGITMMLCFANGQTGRGAGGPGGCRRLSAVLGRGVKFTCLPTFLLRGIRGSAA
jgi:hypothetical protein